MTPKIIGYVLIAIGVLVIVLSAFNGYSVFTKQSPVLPIFSNQAFQAARNSPAELVQASLGISSVEMTFSLNLVMHLLLLGLLVNVGFRLASLGVSLVRPIVVDGTKNRSKSPGD